MTFPRLVPDVHRCIECHVTATGGITSLGMTVWHCSDPHHALCARRVLGLPDDDDS